MVRTVIGTVAGLAVLGVVVTLLQRGSSVMYPLPPGLDPMNPDDAAAFAEHVATMPIGTWLMTMLAEVAGAACGALLAGLCHAMRYGVRRGRWWVWQPSEAP